MPDLLSRPRCASRFSKSNVGRYVTHLCIAVSLACAAPAFSAEGVDLYGDLVSPGTTPAPVDAPSTGPAPDTTTTPPSASPAASPATPAPAAPPEAAAGPVPPPPPALTEEELARRLENQLTRARMAFLFGYYDLARDLWLPLAEEGVPKAQANVGWMYQSGKGMPKDLKKAYQWYLKAASQKHEIAQNNLGVMYEKGWGVKANLKRATYWYREAASVGYSYAQYNYGRMLLDGQGVKKNTEEAAYWLGLAATQGVDDAKGLLIDKTKWGSAPPPAAANAAAPKQQHMLREVMRENWILSQPADSFTMQLISNKNESAISHYLATQSVPDPAAYYKSIVLGEEWYSVIYGVFPSFEEAQRYMKLLPESVLKYKPWIRKFSDVQQLIRAPVE